MDEQTCGAFTLMSVVEEPRSQEHRFIDQIIAVFESRLQEFCPMSYVWGDTPFEKRRLGSSKVNATAGHSSSILLRHVFIAESTSYFTAVSVTTRRFQIFHLLALDKVVEEQTGG